MHPWTNFGVPQNAVSDRCLFPYTDFRRHILLYRQNTFFLFSSGCRLGLAAILLYNGAFSALSQFRAWKALKAQFFTKSHYTEALFINTSLIIVEISMLFSLKLQISDLSGFFVRLINISTEIQKLLLKTEYTELGQIHSYLLIVLKHVYVYRSPRNASDLARRSFPYAVVHMEVLGVAKKN